MPANPASGARLPLLLALVLGAAVAAVCWVRLAPEKGISVECTLREVERSPRAVVYLAEITTDFAPELLTVEPSCAWVRWDPEVSEATEGGRRIAGRVTVGIAGRPADARPGLRVLFSGRPIRWIELGP